MNTLVVKNKSLRDNTMAKKETVKKKVASKKSTAKKTAKKVVKKVLDSTELDEK